MTLPLVLWMGAIVLAITVAVVAQILVVRLLTAGQVRRQQAFEDAWLQVLIGDSEPEAIPPLGPRDAMMFIVLWTRLHDLVIGLTRDRLDIIGQRVGIDLQSEPERGRRRERLDHFVQPQSVGPQLFVAECVVTEDALAVIRCARLLLHGAACACCSAGIHARGRGDFGWLSPVFARAAAALAAAAARGLRSASVCIVLVVSARGKASDADEPDSSE